jgi:peptidoglycan/xylan/chitin deacetylase (PgdA/CDA1 family)
LNPIPILVYHSVSDDPPAWIRELALTTAAFREHVDAIRGSGRESLTVAGFAAALRGNAPMPARPVVITFDDGLADFAETAFPALSAAGLSSTLFVTTGFIATAGGASTNGVLRPPGEWLDVRGLCDLHAAGVEIGAHSHSHTHLDTLSRAGAREEIVRSRRMLEDILAAPVDTFAFPHGHSSPALRRIVAELGFSAACRVRNAFSSQADDVFGLARLMVHADTSASQLEDWLDGRGAPLATRRDRLRTIAWRRYRRGKATITRKPGSDW